MTSLQSECRKNCDTKICLVTGATSGLGEATAYALAREGCLTLVVGRNQGRCNEVSVGIRSRHPGARVESLVADLTCMRQIRELGRHLGERYERLDLLVNNAGARFNRRYETREGLEMTFALNHLAYFCLTQSFLPLLAASADARIINVSSGAHRRGVIDFDDIEGKRTYDGKCAYTQSKLANVLFTYELSRRLEDSRICVNAFNPGGMATRFARNNGIRHWLKHVAAHIWMKDLRTAAVCAEDILYLLTAPELTGVTGKYFDHRVMTSSSDKSYDTDAAQRLWKLSEEITRSILQ
jgi:NAD(P)-dependent dehydrogenase (short-subunit alcohol dehydrogenase family)